MGSITKLRTQQNLDLIRKSQTADHALAENLQVKQTPETIAQLAEGKAAAGQVTVPGQAKGIGERMYEDFAKPDRAKTEASREQTRMEERRLQTLAMDVLDGASGDIKSTLRNGQLDINGTKGNDDITLRRDKGDIVVDAAGKERFRAPEHDIDQINVATHGGDDSINNQIKGYGPEINMSTGSGSDIVLNKTNDALITGEGKNYFSNRGNNVQLDTLPGGQWESLRRGEATTNPNGFRLNQTGTLEDWMRQPRANEGMEKILPRDRDLLRQLEGIHRNPWKSMPNNFGRSQNQRPDGVWFGGGDSLSQKTGTKGHSFLNSPLAPTWLQDFQALNSVLSNYMLREPSIIESIRR